MHFTFYNYFIVCQYFQIFCSLDDYLVSFSLLGGPLFRHICFKIVWYYFHILQELGSKVCHILLDMLLCHQGSNFSYVLNVMSCSELLDTSFLFALDNGERYSVEPMRFTTLLKLTRVKVVSLRNIFYFSFLLITGYACIICTYEFSFYINSLLRV